MVVGNILQAVLLVLAGGLLGLVVVGCGRR